MKKILALFSLLLFCVLPTLGQGTNQGSEVTISYAGTNAQLVQPNTPLTNLAAGTGVNTFILSIANPTVAIRVYVTNNTANSCASPVTIQMFSSSDAQVSSFNNSLANWQTVLLQSPTISSLVSSVSTSIPASAAVYVTSTAIISPKVVIQVVSTAGACATTLVEVTAVVSQVSLASPLVSTVNNNPNSTVGNQVQGILPNGSSANLINPVLVSGQGPATNSGFQTSGLDTVTPLAETIGLNGTVQNIFMGKSPVPTQGINELTLAIFSGINALCGAASINTSAGWSMINGTAIPGGGSYGAAGLFPAVGGVNLFRNGQGGGCPWQSNSVIYTELNFTASSITLPTYTNLACCSLAYSAGGNPLGSTILIMIPTAVPNTCTVTGVTDTLGLSYGNIGNFFDATITGTNNISGMSIWASTSTNPGGADTVTAATTGTCGPSALYMDIPGVVKTALVSPQIPLEMDSQGAQVFREDAIGVNQVTCSVTLSTLTTTQLANCVANPTINGASGRYYITDIQLNTTTAGTATTIQLKAGTGVNCASALVNLSAILYSNTTVGLQTVQGFRTPLIAPVTDEICATQAGTTAGTTVVEVHGFIAP